MFFSSNLRARSSGVQTYARKVPALPPPTSTSTIATTDQLVINTSTTVVTFLMVFLIQNTQNRDTEALRLKLDELILATKEARNEFVEIEDLGDDELKAMERSLREMAGSARDS